MNDQLPYTNEQWNDLPVPDGETSWQKMELLLDKDKKRRVPFWWWRYAALALLLAGVVTGGWLWVSSKDNENGSLVTTQQQTNVPKEATKDVVLPDRNRKTKTPLNSTQPNNTIITDGLQQEKLITSASEVLKSKRNESVAMLEAGKKTTAPQNATVISTERIKPATQTQNSENRISKQDKSNPVKVPIQIKPTADSLVINNNVKKDSIRTKDSAKTIIAPPVVSNEDPKQKKKKRSVFVWSAGAGLQQAIAVNGQQSSSFNYNGKKNSLSDHIPSVYLRLQKGPWFTQAEFQFSAPQPVENLYFSQKTRYDVASLSLNTERFTIQKLYYHQLPVSINYHVMKNLSVGVGGMYNILAGAVTQQEIKSKNVQTGTETTTKNLAPVKGFKDSFLYKTTAGIILQTDYHWKRFSLGFRYTQNLQPFIKYTKPDGTILDKKTQALQAVLRFRLWSLK